MRGLKYSLVVASLLLCGAQVEALDRTGEGLKALQKMSDGFAELAAQVKPGVVAITTERKMEAPSRSRSPFFHTPQQEQQPRDGAGSGVLVRFKGEDYILTNNHVVDGAANIRVELPDSRFFDAEVVGADSLSDLALLKIDGENLPTVELGNSDVLREGEWVLAIGNPFGFSHSISTGIVSALGRDRSQREYGSYIQTDAAINPGNSGGALVNLRGNVGIGFAIPVNMAKFVMGELTEHGQVRRGLLGVQINDLNPLLAEAMGLETTDGVLITKVLKDRAAAKGGVEEEDVVLEINGKKVHDSTELKSIIGRTSPGTKVDLLVLRSGDKKRLKVELEALTEAALASNEAESDDAQVDPGKLGLAVTELTSELANRLGYEEMEGVLVAQVRPGSEAARRGLQRGLLIVGINRTVVQSLEDYREALSQIESGEAFTLRVRSRNSKRLLGMRMPEN